MDEVTRFHWCGSWWALAIGHDGGHPRVLGCGPEQRFYLIVPARRVGRIIAEQGVNCRCDLETGQLAGHPAPVRRLVGLRGLHAVVRCPRDAEALSHHNGRDAAPTTRHGDVGAEFDEGVAY
jgi:hypothetical protein